MSDDNGVVNGVLSRLVPILLAVALLVSAAPPAVAAEPLAVTMIGPSGQLTASAASGRVELRLPGRAPIVFDGARVTATRTRVVILARTQDRTLYAWGARGGRNGGVGLVTRVKGKKRVDTAGFVPNEVTVTGGPPTSRTVAPRV